MTQSSLAPSGITRALTVLLAALAGAFLGGVVNMTVILASAAALPPPAGVDVNDAASINAHIHEYSVVQLLCPFFAHAIGTFVGAIVATKVGARAGVGRIAAFLVGLLFLAGGVGAVAMIPNAPLWFSALDLGVAYLPMAHLGHKLARQKDASQHRA